MKKLVGQRVHHRAHGEVLGLDGQVGSAGPITLAGVAMAREAILHVHVLAALEDLVVRAGRVPGGRVIDGGRLRLRRSRGDDALGRLVGGILGRPGRETSQQSDENQGDDEIDGPAGP